MDSGTCGTQGLVDSGTRGLGDDVDFGKCELEDVDFWDVHVGSGSCGLGDLWTRGLGAGADLVRTCRECASPPPHPPPPSPRERWSFLCIRL